MLLKHAVMKLKQARWKDILESNRNGTSGGQFRLENGSRQCCHHNSRRHREEQEKWLSPHLIMGVVFSASLSSGNKGHLHGKEYLLKQTGSSLIMRVCFPVKFKFLENINLSFPHSISANCSAPYLTVQL